MKKYIEKYLLHLTDKEFVEILNQILEKTNVRARVLQNSPANIAQYNTSLPDFIADCDDWKSTDPYYVQPLENIGGIRSTNDPKRFTICGCTAYLFVATCIAQGYLQDTSLSLYLTSDTFNDTLLSLTHKAHILPTKEVYEAFCDIDNIWRTEEAAIWAIQERFPQLRTRVKIECPERFQDVYEFAKSINMLDSLLDCFKSLSDWSNEIRVAGDFCENCFSFVERRPDGSHGINGGIIFHGSPEQGYQENGSCMMTPKYGWSIHT